MTLRTIPRAALGAWLKAVRWPLDRAAGLVGGDASRIAVDRFEAAVRGTAGAAMNDPELRADAERRRRAADQRERAVELHAEAQERASDADQKLQQHQQSAQQRREQASEQAQQRKQEAAEQAEQRKHQAAEAAERRQEASRKAAEAGEQAIEDRSRHERLEQAAKQEEAV